MSNSGYIFGVATLCECVKRETFMKVENSFEWFSKIISMKFPNHQHDFGKSFA